ncbi:MAG TPA: hypothetical protein DCY20_06685 [Firmicutes bacterium]|nr:hypothetical protein [Bacillota bacterium]
MFVIVLLLLSLILISIKLGMMVSHYIKSPVVQAVSKLPLGFFCLLGLVQLLYGPFMQFHLSTKALAILTATLFGALLVLSLFDIKQLVIIIQKKLRCKKTWVGLAVTAVFIMAYTLMASLETYWDFNFYLPFIQSNIDATHVNTMNPWNGITERLHWMYNYQSYYVLFSMLAKLSNVDGTLLMIWLPSLMYFIVLPMLIFDVIGIVSTNKKHQIQSFIIFFLISIPRLDFLEYPYYGVNFRLYLFMYLLMCLSDYVKTRNKKLMVLILLLSFAHVATQSSALFISVVLMYGLLAYDVLYLKGNESWTGIFLSIPVATYVLNISYDISPKLSGVLFLVTVFGYLVIYGLAMKKKQALQVAQRVMVFLIPILIYFMACVLIVVQVKTPVTVRSFFNMMVQQFYNGYSIKLLDGFEILIAAIVISYFVYVLSKRKALEQRLYVFIPVVTLVVFFNPVVAPCVSLFLTGIVYERLFILVYSGIGLVICLDAVYTRCASRRAQLLVNASLISVGLLLFVNNMLHQEQPKMLSVKALGKYDLRYKQSYDFLALQSFLNEEVSNESTIFSTDLRLRLGLRNGILVFTVPEYRLYEAMDVIDENSLYGLYDVLSNVESNVDVETILPLCEQFGIDYVVLQSSVSNEVRNQLQKETTLIFENEGYLVYERK